MRAERAAAGAAHGADRPSAADPSSGDCPVPERTPGTKTGRRASAGYFRAPIALGHQLTPGARQPSGPSSTQVSYGPNRTSRLELLRLRVHAPAGAGLGGALRPREEEARRRRRRAGWGTGIRRPGTGTHDAAWAPGMAYVRSTRTSRWRVRPNIALTVGAWWPRFGYFEKYDTYTLGRFRQVGDTAEVDCPCRLGCRGDC